ncbi:uncharacterized protein LOC128954246 [Oppia nitens]|uniref:uncharacterized protein LOC128954246 n=1 Tax=Oppia nitens TaxID=1686743 RepID=UPI0023DA950C|nr:uncharacterized protein LOC128954246 [Oppia nitens]
MGMKSSLLYTEEKKQLRNSLIIENKMKFKKQLKQRSTTTTTTTTDDNKRIRHLVTTIDNNNNTSYSLTTKTSTGTDSSETTSSSNNGSNESTTTTTTTTTTPEILVSVLSEPSIGRPITTAAADNNPNDIQFNQLEANYFGELCAAVGKQLMPYSSAVNVGHCGGDQPISVVDVDNKWDGIWILDQRLDKKIAGFVKMSKCLHAFRALTESDQLILLTKSSLKMEILQMINIFDFQGMYWLISFNNQKVRIGLDLFREFPITTTTMTTKPLIDNSIYDNYKEFMCNIGLDWESDPVIINLLTIIILFDPNLPNLVNKNFIKYYQNIYQHLLQRYLQIKYRSRSLSQTKLLRLKQCMKLLDNLGNNIRYQCSVNSNDSNKHRSPPLVCEIIRSMHCKHPGSAAASKFTYNRTARIDSQ